MRDKSLRLEPQKVQFCEDALAAKQIGCDQIEVEFACAKCHVAQDLTQELKMRFGIDLTALPALLQRAMLSRPRRRFA